MSDARATLAEVRGLLERLPGVSVVSTDASPGGISVVMKIDRLESLGPIVYCVGGANVHLGIWTTAPPKPIEERSNPLHLRYSVTAKESENGPNGALKAFQFFGVYLVWYLHAIGALEAKEANRLLTDWDGKLVAA
jgi:hypothetical protein